MRIAARFTIIALVILMVPTILLAQATTTGGITGTVRMPDGTAIPGVTVTATSPALQGARTTYTTDTGEYVLRALPPGRYTVRFELAGLQTVERQVLVELGGQARVDAALSSVVGEAITVTATAPTALTTTEVAVSHRSETIERLPVARTLAAIALNTPGVTATTYNAGQLRIQGATGFDNVFLVDGTDVNDNLFGTANNLYIEDAIEETRVLTAGISAEYGRFTGGVVNAVTKSGGNTFTGSVRGDFTNPSWREEAPIEVQRGVEYPDTLSEVYQGTFGGPIVRDRLWFFLAGRQQESTATQAFPALGTFANIGTTNERWEAKLTGSITSNHQLQASYMDNATTQTNLPSFTFTTDPLGVQPSRSTPNTRWAAFYNGVLTPQLFAELKYSQKKFGFRGSGSTSTIITDSPFITRTGAQYHYNFPYFDANDPEDRDNQDFVAALSYFLTTGAIGTHDIKVGYEDYTSSRTGGNSQTATGYVFFNNYLMNGAVPATENGRFVPIFVPVGSGTFTYINNWIPSRGAELALTTRSIFVNDTWNLNRNFSFNLGGRYEMVSSEVTGAAVPSFETSRFSPRLGASFDVRGDGRLKIDATYAEYSGKYSERQFGVNSPVGTPSLVQLAYIGPAGQGLGHTPGFTVTPENYTIIGGSFPTANVFMDDDLKSPVVDEWTLGVGSALGRFGFAKLLYSNRQWSSFIDDFIDTSTGFTNVNVGNYNPNFTGNFAFDNIVYRNTDEPRREYEAIQLLSQLQPLARWTAQINYTHELKNHGTYVGEATNQPGNPSLFGDYPEFYFADRNNPYGRLPGFQEHRLNILNTYRQPLGAFGNLDFGLIYTYESPLTFSQTATANPTAAQAAAVAAAGYKRPPTSQTVFFGERGAFEFNESHTLDVGLTYGLPLFGRIEPWIKADVFNVLNDQPVLTFNTSGTTCNTVTATGACANAQFDANGLPLTFVPGSLYGQPTSANNYQTGREYRFAAGIRF